MLQHDSCGMIRSNLWVTCLISMMGHRDTLAPKITNHIGIIGTACKPPLAALHRNSKISRQWWRPYVTGLLLCYYYWLINGAVVAQQLRLLVTDQKVRGSSPLTKALKLYLLHRCCIMGDPAL